MGGGLEWEGERPIIRLREVTKETKKKNFKKEGIKGTDREEEVNWDRLKMKPD